MSRVDSAGYVVPPHKINNTFLVRHASYRGQAYVGLVYFPVCFVGKRVRFKVEVIEE